MSAPADGLGDCEPVFAGCVEQCRPGRCPCLEDDPDGDGRECGAPLRGLVDIEVKGDLL